MCADPLMCAPTLYPNSKDIYRYRPAWRAREAEILVLAMRGHEKKMKARRCGTLHDTSLCKVLHIDAADENADDDNAEGDNAQDERAAKRAADRILQIDVQRFFRLGIRYLREIAPAESPSNYAIQSESYIRSDFYWVRNRSGTMINYTWRNGKHCNKSNTCSS